MQKMRNAEFYYTVNVIFKLVFDRIGYELLIQTWWLQIITNKKKHHQNQKG